MFILIVKFKFYSIYSFNSQLDDSYDYSPRQVSSSSGSGAFLIGGGGCGRQRARSLSCSPCKSIMGNEQDIVAMQNEKFKDKFPNACQQMEEKLKVFIELNLDFKTQIDYCQSIDYWI